ncbi:MAG: M48 family metallopeptidase [Candidatus Spechtbacterales bacterium]
MAANLYSHKDSNVRKTWFLITVFLLLVIGFGWVLSYVFDNVAILAIAVIVSIAMSVGSYWWSDKLVLSMTGAKEASPQEYSELHRIVENLAITAGLPKPKIYVLHESAPNAFATGRDPEHAVVAVTTGLLDRLERVELEGVLAHELSHIGNRDMLVSTVVVVLAGVIIFASDILMRSFLFGGMRGDDRKGSAIFLAIGIVALILAPILATILRLAVSRKREFLADASGALLTRYPDGLARALEKIAADPTPMRRASNATAHLFIANPFKKDVRGHAQEPNWFTKLFMTHPPTSARIRALRGMQE